MTSDALKLTTEPKNLRMMSIYSMLLRLWRSLKISKPSSENTVRSLETYDKRKAFQERELEALLIRLNAKRKIRNGSHQRYYSATGKKKADLEAQLIEREFPDLNGMDYLIGMPIGSLTVRSAMLWWRTQKTRRRSSKYSQLHRWQYGCVSWMNCVRNCWKMWNNL
jgi:hypothetical protein